MKRLLVSIALLGFGPAWGAPQSTGSQAAPTKSAIMALKDAAPAASWDNALSAVADVTCDGVADTVVVGRERKAVWVGILRPHGKPITLRFDVDFATQAGFCAQPVRIEVIPHNCENELGPLAGCVRVKGCKDFSLQDDMCDAFVFYWDSGKGAINWWRE